MFPAKALLCMGLFFCYGLSSAQEVIGYYDASWKPVKEDKAVYLSSITKKDSFWYRTDYYVSTRRTVREGLYKDAAGTIKHGEILGFFLNGQLEYRRWYKDDLRHGASFSYYPTGMMRDSFYFIHDVPAGFCAGWYPSGNAMVEMQMDSTGSGTGLAVGFFDNGTVSFKGRMGRGLRKTGNWFYYHTNGNRASVLQFAQEDSTATGIRPQVKADIFENTYYDSTVTYYNAICYDVNGVQQTPCTVVNKKPEYQGGLQAWSRYLEQELRQVMPRLSQTVRYTAIFVVETNGKPGEVQLDNRINPSLDKDILRIFQDSKKWVPAIHNNRLLPYVHYQSLTLNTSP